MPFEFATWDGVDANPFDSIICEPFDFQYFDDSAECPGSVCDETITPSSELLEIFCPENLQRPFEDFEDSHHSCESAQYDPEKLTDQSPEFLFQVASDFPGEPPLKKRRDDGINGAQESEFSTSISNNPLSSPVYVVFARTLEARQIMVESFSSLGRDEELVDHILAGIRQSTTPPSLTSWQSVKEYYSGGCQTSSISIYTPLVCQKSYGKEKRFCCPAPMINISTEVGIPNVTGSIYIRGMSQKTQSKIGKIDPVISFASRKDSDSLFESTLLFKNVFLSDEILALQPSAMSNLRSSNCAKTLAKAFQFEFQLGSLGHFESRPINLISKPPKKRRLSDRTDGSGFISNFSQVALFNRVKGQTGSTRYLALATDDDGSLLMDCSPSQWEPFTIQCCDRNAENDSLSSGSIVQFKSCKSAWLSAKYRVRLVDDSAAAAANRPSPVLQNMQKITIECYESPSLFLGTSANNSGKVQYFKGFSNSSENCVWTLALIDSCKYTWFTQTPSGTKGCPPLANMPVISSCNILKSPKELQTILVLRFSIEQQTSTIPQIDWDLFVGETFALDQIFQHAEMDDSTGVRVHTLIGLIPDRNVSGIRLNDQSDTAVEPFRIHQNGQLAVNSENAGFPLLMIKRHDGTLFDTGLSIQ